MLRCEVGRNKEEGTRCTGALGNPRVARRQEKRHLSEEGYPGALPVVRAQLECTMKEHLCFYYQRVSLASSPSH